MRNMAYCTLRKEPHYRHEAFIAGLEAADYVVSTREPRRINAGDVMVLWNLSGTNEVFADCFKKGGGTVYVVENGYIGKDEDGQQYYAIAKDGHNGSGQWYIGGPERLDILKINLGNWKHNPEGHILVCPNRYIGSKQMRMPADWLQKTVERLGQWNRPIRVRHHPGNWQKTPPKVPLSADLEGVYAVVIWSSTVGVHALAEGYPVVVTSPRWICSRMGGVHSMRGISGLDWSHYNLRYTDFIGLSWAQWTVKEISQGVPFQCLLQI